MQKTLSSKRCPLRNDYKQWSQAKKEDRLFSTCPSCGCYGNHVILDTVEKEKTMEGI